MASSGYFLQATLKIPFIAFHWMFCPKNGSIVFEKAPF